MSGFQFGEMDVREQNPWAYDATNDLLKPGDDLWLTAAGVVDTCAISYSDVIAGENENSQAAAITIPAGKVGYLLDFSGSMATALGTGTLIFEMYANPGGAGNAGVYSMLPPQNGGMLWMPNPRSFTFQPGTCGFAIFSTEATVAHRVSCRMAVAII